MKLALFDYQLPPELIAQSPNKDRASSKLMVLNRDLDKQEHCIFSQIPQFLNEKDVLVLNNTKVMPAKLIGKRTTGGRVEMLVTSFKDSTAIAMIQVRRRPTPGEIYLFQDYKVSIVEKTEQGWKVDFHDENAISVMEKIGNPPLPPYIKRKSEIAQELLPEDHKRYQTVYAQKSGAIAAPTAGLHFTQKLLDQIKAKGIEVVYITLHVGAGTFLPIRSEEIEEHQMHSEYYHISPQATEAINTALEARKRIIAVGTTSCRTLEGAFKNGKIACGNGQTNIYIYPGFKFQVVQGLVTNFHLPKSTLLLLVSAFAGREKILAAYQTAIEQKYRFYSYGDAMFIA